MKFCKDCKHGVLPSPVAHLYGGTSTAMCAHPNAPRDVVYGNLKLTCFEARGMACAERTICYPEARLFEPRPEPEPVAEAPQPDPEPKVGLLRRLISSRR